MILVYRLVYFLGLIEYSLFRSTNKYSYIAFRKLHGLTNGGINKSYSKKISLKKGKYKFPDITTGIIGNVDSGRLDKIISDIEEKGYTIFDEKLPEDVCQRILDYSMEIPSKVVGEQSDQTGVKYDPNNPIAPIYRFQEEDVLRHNDIKDIFYDVNFIRIAQEYLGCKPLNNSIIMWWSSLYGKSASSRAAQLYHFDMDHPKFIKFFIYLTDVDTNSGPHCYVRGTHKNKPKSLAKDKRYSDSEIQQHYEPSEIIEIDGSRGTVVAVDTSGIHKGKLPIDRDRLIVQIEFTNSFFGQKVSRPSISEKPGADYPQHGDFYKEVYTRLQVS